MVEGDGGRELDAGGLFQAPAKLDGHERIETKVQEALVGVDREVPWWPRTSAVSWHTSETSRWS